MTAPVEGAPRGLQIVWGRDDALAYAVPLPVEASLGRLAAPRESMLGDAVPFSFEVPLGARTTDACVCNGALGDLSPLNVEVPLGARITAASVCHDRLAAQRESTLGQAAPVPVEVPPGARITAACVRDDAVAVVPGYAAPLRVEPLGARMTATWNRDAAVTAQRDSISGEAVPVLIEVPLDARVTAACVRDEVLAAVLGYAAPLRVEPLGARMTARWSRDAAETAERVSILGDAVPILIEIPLDARVTAAPLRVEPLGARMTAGWSRDAAVAAERESILGDAVPSLIEVPLNARVTAAGVRDDALDAVLGAVPLPVEALLARITAARGRDAAEAAQVNLLSGRAN